MGYFEQAAMIENMKAYCEKAKTMVQLIEQLREAGYVDEANRAVAFMTSKGNLKDAIRRLENEGLSGDSSSGTHQ